jgi:hypothetical protein
VLVKTLERSPELLLLFFFRFSISYLYATFAFTDASLYIPLTRFRFLFLSSVISFPPSLCPDCDGFFLYTWHGKTIDL